MVWLIWANDLTYNILVALLQKENSMNIKGKVLKIRPDFSYHRLYGTLIISCTFDKDIDDLVSAFL